MTNNRSNQIKKYSGAIARGIIGEIPAIGSIVVELLNTTIPNKRQERIEKLLNILASKVFDIDQEFLKERFNSDDFIDIYEDVLLQTVRATTQDRIEYLASVLEKGLKNEDFEYLTKKRLLEILGKINDVEVIILQFYSLDNITREEFRNKHEGIFKVQTLEKKTDDDKEAEQIFDHYIDNLVSLGLLGYVDSLSFQTISATELGHMLLNMIGLEHNNRFKGEPLTAIDVLNALIRTEKKINKNIDQAKKDAKKELETASKNAQKLIESEVRKFPSIISSTRRIH